MPTAPASPHRTGRPRSTTRADLERIGFARFAEQGFEQTTVEDIARAAGIARRTFFRYFASKADLVWGDFEGQLSRLRELLDAAPAEVPATEALRAAVVEFNRYDDTEVTWHRQRMDLILNVPTLQADATLRYASWRAVVAEFTARRVGLRADALLPRLVGHTALAAALSAYEYWLSNPGSDLSDLLQTTLTRLTPTFPEVSDAMSAAGP
jgi:mycofactocin system transcriptional regulator